MNCDVCVVAMYEWCFYGDSFFCLFFFFLTDNGFDEVFSFKISFLYVFEFYGDGVQEGICVCVYIKKEAVL